MQIQRVDCRPSDGLILAAQRDAPIYVTPEVMEQAGRPLSEAVVAISHMEPVDRDT